jgi:hypothetical protein
MTGFPPAELYWYESETGYLRIDVRGPYYPFDFPGENTLAESMHFVACNLYRCEFAAKGSGQIYDESRLPGTTSDITTFDYVLNNPNMTIVKLNPEERKAYKQKTWHDVVDLDDLNRVDIVFKYM